MVKQFKMFRGIIAQLISIQSAYYAIFITWPMTPKILKVKQTIMMGSYVRTKDLARSSLPIRVAMLQVTRITYRMGKPKNTRVREQLASRTKFAIDTRIVMRPVAMFVFEGIPKKVLDDTMFFLLHILDCRWDVNLAGEHFHQCVNYNHYSYLECC